MENRLSATASSRLSQYSAIPFPWIEARNHFERGMRFQTLTREVYCWTPFLFFPLEPSRSLGEGRILRFFPRNEMATVHFGFDRPGPGFGIRFGVESPGLAWKSNLGNDRPLVFGSLLKRGHLLDPQEDIDDHYTTSEPISDLNLRE